MKKTGSAVIILNLGTLSVVGTTERDKAVVFMLTCDQGSAFMPCMRVNTEAVLHEALPYSRISGIRTVTPEDVRKVVIIFEVEIGHVDRLSLREFLRRMAEKIVDELKSRDNDTQLLRERDGLRCPYTLPRIQGSVKFIE